MYRFWQDSDTSDWKIVKDAAPTKPWKLANELNACRITIMAISGDPDIEEADNISYQGPLYFDIDNLDIERAIESTVELVEKLRQQGVSDGDIEIHLSGSKGCHIFVDPTLFSSGRPLKNLPRVYERIALDLYVPGLDLAIYSFGKGRMFRPPNSLRPDGKYKVRVSVEELLNMTPAKYADLVKSPRIIDWGQPPKKQAMGLGILFNMHKNVKPIEDYKGMKLSDEVFAKLAGTIPPCIEDLASGKENSNTAFNKAALNVACFTARSGMESGRVDAIMSRIADFTTSQKYSTARDRKRHLQGMQSYVQKNAGKYKFSCPGMLSVISTHPCNNCPIKGEDTEAQGLPSILDSMFVYKHLGQYFSDPDFEKPITSFTMVRDAAVVDEDTGRVVASVIKIHAPQKGTVYTIPDFSESAWASKQEFKKEITGLDGIVLLGNDNDVSRIRMTLAKEVLTGISEVRMVAKCSRIGIHYKRKSGPQDVRDPKHQGIFFYIEPDKFSVSSLGQMETHILEGNALPAPSLRFLGKEFGDPISDEANDAFSLLMKVNSPKVVSQVLGWYLSVHLKVHTGLLWGQHPLLCISGISGSGKNKGIALFQRLAGLGGSDALATLEAPMSTNLPFQLSLSNSSTVPRVINEMNPKSLGKSNYTFMTEILKAGFDNRSVNKGRLGGGNRHGGMNVSNVELRITAPIVTLSEEPLHTPAVLHRAVLVAFEPSGHSVGSEAFYKLQSRADNLLGIALAMVNEAMHTSLKQVEMFFKAAVLPEEVAKADIPERLLYGYQIILMAYDWALARLPDKGLSGKNISLLTECRQAFLDYLCENVTDIVKDSNINEVDKVLKDIALLAYYSTDPNAYNKIERGRHYTLTDNSLFLDMLVIYPILQRFKNGSGDPLGLKTSDAFLKSVKGIRYFISDDSVPPDIPTNGRGVLELDMELLRRANIPVQMF